MTQVIKIDENTVEINGEVYVKKDGQVIEWPKLGDKYYYLSKEGYIYGDEWDGYDFERDRYRQGNIFRTEAEAIHEKERRNLMTDLRKFADFEPDWEDDNQMKYYLAYNHKRCEWGYYGIRSICQPNQVYFSSNEKAEQALQKFSDWLKYLLPYKK